MKTEKSFGLVVILSIQLGCGLFKTTTKSTAENKEQHEMERSVQLTAEADRSKDTQLLTFSKDSVWNAYTIRLWPKGKLSYSPELGFEGLFDSVEVTGNSKRLSASGAQSKTSQQEKTRVNFGEQVKEKDKKSSNQLVLKRFTDLKVVMIGLFLLLIIGFFVLKRHFF